MGDFLEEVQKVETDVPFTGRSLYITCET